jgi:hypothetical protein
LVAIPDPELTYVPAQILTQTLQDSSIGPSFINGFAQRPRYGEGDGSKPFVPLGCADVIDSQNKVKWPPPRVAEKRNADQSPSQMAISLEVALLGLESARLTAQQPAGTG